MLDENTLKLVRNLFDLYLLDQPKMLLNGFNLEKIPPKTPLAKSLALPNLSHLVNAIAFNIVNTIAMTTNIKDKNSNFKMATTPKMIQNAGAPYKKPQNTLESIGLMYLFGSAVSKTQILSPISLVSFHQRNPTINLPLMFLTFQKSAARSKMTKMNSSMKLFVKRRPKRYTNNDPILNPRKNNNAIGCDDSESFWYRVLTTVSELACVVCVVS